MIKRLINPPMRSVRDKVVKMAIFLAMLFLGTVSLFAMEIAAEGINHKENQVRHLVDNKAIADHSFKEMLKLFLTDKKKYKEHVCRLPKDMKFFLARDLLHNNGIIQIIGSRLTIPRLLFLEDPQCNSVAFNDAGTHIIATHKNEVFAFQVNSSNGHFVQAPELVRFVAANALGNRIAVANVNNRIRIINFPDGNYVAFNDLPEGRLQFNVSGDKFVIFHLYGGVVLLGDVETLHLQELEGHESFVKTAAFNNVGTKLVTGSFDGSAKIWNVETGSCLHTLKGHTSVLLSACFNTLGTKIVTASWDGTAKIWDAETGACLQTLKGHTNKVRSVAFNSLGTKVVTASTDGTAKIWHVETGVCLHTLKGHSECVKSAEFNARSNKIITCSEDHTVKIWNAATGVCLFTFENGGKRIEAAQFNDLGNKALITSVDNTATIYDLSPLEEVMDWLERSCTLEQALLLNFISKAAFIQEVYKKREPSEKFRFDFNKCKHLKKHFKAMPKVLKKCLKPYVKRYRKRRK